jgi:hypothetical protein
LPKRLPAISVVALPLLLSGCFVPFAISIASYGFDGMAYATNGKSLTDIALSQVVGQDCATFRVIKAEWICRDRSPEQERELVIQRWRIAQQAKLEAKAPHRWKEPRDATPDPPIPVTVIAEADAAKARAEERIQLAQARKNGGKTPVAVAAATPLAGSLPLETAEPDTETRPDSQTRIVDTAADVSTGMRPAQGALDTTPVQLAALPAAAPPAPPAVSRAKAHAAVANPAPAVASPPLDAAQSLDPFAQLPTTFFPPLKQYTKPAQTKSAQAKPAPAKPVAARPAAIQPAATRPAPAKPTIAPAASLSRPALQLVALHSPPPGVYIVLGSYGTRTGARQAMSQVSGFAARLATTHIDRQSLYRIVSGPYAESQLGHVEAVLNDAGYQRMLRVHDCRQMVEAGCVDFDHSQLAALTPIR